MAMAHADHLIYGRGPQFGFADPLMPSPMSVELTVSARRDASFADVVFDGHVPISALTKSHTLTYNGNALWIVGADNTRWNTSRGRRTTEVKFRVGPYRAARETRYLSAWYLHEELLLQLPRLIGEPPLYRQETTGQVGTEVARWRYLLGGNDWGRAGDPDIRDDLMRYMNILLQQYAKFDDSVRDLYENLHLLVMVDPEYLTQYTLQELELGQVGSPEFVIRNCLDQVAAHPELRVTTVLDTDFEIPAQLSQRPREETLTLFWHDGRVFDDDRYFNPNDRAFNAGDSLARLGRGPADSWQVARYDVAQFAGRVNPWTLYTTALMPSLEHAHLEAYLQQQRAYFANRERVARGVAPHNAAALLAMVPGQAVRIRSNQQVYWVTELRVNIPPGSFGLDLVYPGADALADARTAPLGEPEQPEVGE